MKYITIKMTNVVQIQIKYISLRAQPFLLRASSPSLVCSENSEGANQKGACLCETPQEAGRSPQLQLGQVVSEASGTHQ